MARARVRVSGSTGGLNADKHVRQIRLRVDLVGMAGRQQRLQNGKILPRIIVAHQHEVFFRARRRAAPVLQYVVWAQFGVVQIDKSCGQVVST